MRHTIRHIFILSQHTLSRPGPALRRFVTRHISMVATVVSPQALPDNCLDVASGTSLQTRINVYPTKHTAFSSFKEGKPLRDEESIAGINIAILKFAASQVLLTTEAPTLQDGGDGGFNRLFILEFPIAGKKLLARVSLKNARTPCRIEQAVATMSFARHVRGIPTPQVYAWNASSDNPVGAPYIIQEWVEDVVEPWEVFKRSTHKQRAIILDDSTLR